MTDRIHSLTVSLEREIREDDCESIVNAIKAIRGVLCVKNEVADSSFYTARQQAKRDLQNRMRKILYE